MIRRQAGRLEVTGPVGMHAIGRAFGELAPVGSVVLLEGPLGAGKTTFAQGTAAGCGVEGPISSPTFNLILRYSGTRPFTHVDLYRLQDATELETLDLDEILGGSGVTCIEWPDLVRDLVRPPCAVVAIAMLPPDADQRHASIELAGSGWEALGRRLAIGDVS